MRPARRSMGDTTIGRKLFLSFGTAMAITLLIALVGFISNAILSNTVERVVESVSVRQSLAGEISLGFSELLSLERGMNLRAMMNDSAAADTYHRDFLAESDRLADLTGQLEPLIPSTVDKALCAELAAANLQLRHLHDQSYMRISNGATGASYSASSASPYTIFRDQFLPPGNVAKSMAAHLLEDQRALIALEAFGAHRAEMRSRWLTSFMLLLFFVVGGVLSRIIVDSNRTLRQFAADLGKGAIQIAAAAAQVSISSQSLARGASEQAAFIEATSASAEEISSMARRNTDNAQATAGMVADSQRYVQEGNRALDQMVAAMDGVAAASRKISKIVKLIDQIAFQTNILALNAAVEAARAGEAGLSFAVVADEVRELAQRTAQAAKDTAELIDDCIAKSHTGKLKVDEVAAAIRSMTNESSKVKLLVDEISDGSREQSRGIDQVSKAVLQMEQVTQGTAAGAEQSAAAAEQLNIQFQTLKDIAEDLAAMLGSAIQQASPLPSVPPGPLASGSKSGSFPLAPGESGPALQPL